MFYDISYTIYPRFLKVKKCSGHYVLYSEDVASAFSLQCLYRKPLK
jgi:hypothetical protein